MGTKRRGSRHSGVPVTPSESSGIPKFLRSRVSIVPALKKIGGDFGSLSSLWPRSELVPDDFGNLTINQPLVGSVVNGTIALNGKVTDTTTSIVEVKVDSGSYVTMSGTLAWSHALNLGALSNGSHSITVRSKNSGGTVLASKTITFTYTANASLPAGVTLRDIDGGANYFGNWTFSYPVVDTFYPIGVWAETIASGSSDVLLYKNMGVNTFSHIWGGPTAGNMNALIANSGMYAVGMCTFNDFTFSTSFDTSYGNALAAHFFGDEMDTLPYDGGLPAWLAAGYVEGNYLGQRYTRPEGIRNMSNLVRTHDPNRPVYNQYTKPIAQPGWGSWYLTDADKHLYCTASDIVSFDWYVVSDPYTANGQVWNMWDATMNARELSNYCKPVWPFIETSKVTTTYTRDPTDAQMGAEIWNCIIAGARGYEYFNHCFYSGEETQHLLIDPYYATTSAYLHGVNDTVAALAPVINARFADGYVTTTGSIHTMTKYYGGKFYVFAIPYIVGAQNNIQFTLASTATTTATVLNESRTRTVTAGVFTDSFTDENICHIYRIE